MGLALVASIEGCSSPYGQDWPTTDLGGRGSDGCTWHNQCASQVCLLEQKTCAPEGRVTYVERRTKGCPKPTDVDAGTRARPLCDLADVRDRLDRPVIMVHESKDGAAYQLPMLPHGEWWVYGPLSAADMTMQAATSGPTRPEARVQDTSELNVSGDATLHISGVTFEGRGLDGPGKSGLNCVATGKGQPWVDLSAVLFRNMDGVALDSTGCRLTIKHSLFVGNRGGAVALRTGTSYSIDSSIFAGVPDATGALVQIYGTNVSGTGIQNSQLYGNWVNGIGGAVLCQGTTDKPLKQVTICRNSEDPESKSPNPSRRQITGSCVVDEGELLPCTPSVTAP